MNILVCVKQVPDTTEIKIDPVKNTLIREGVPSIVNPFDGYALEAAARDILVADFVNGTKNTMQGTAEIHVEPNLKTDTEWHLLCTKRPIKPLIFQQRKKAKFVSKTSETDDNVFMSKKFIYGVDSRGNAGFGFWQMAVGSDGTK